MYVGLCFVCFIFTAGTSIAGGMLAYLFMDSNGSAATHKVSKNAFDHDLADRCILRVPTVTDLCQYTVVGTRFGTLVRRTVCRGFLGPTYPCIGPHKPASHVARRTRGLHRPACVL